MNEKKQLLIISIAVFFALSFTIAQARKTFITIGTGGITGIYYPAGGAIAKMVNKKKKQYDIRATVESTPGSVFNVNAVIKGDFEFGLVQSDRQFQAINGLGEWKDKGPQKDLRAVFSIHPESVTLVAAVDSGIIDIRDLRGKKVNIGNPGSGQRQNSLDALQAAGLDDPENNIQVESVKAEDAPGLLQDGLIDAFFYTVGHPADTIKEATSGVRKVRFVSITGIETLLADNPYYTKAKILIKNYPGAVNDNDVPTFGVKATLVTSAKVPDEVVYIVTKVVFDNLEDFKKLHPAFASLTKESMLKGLSAPIHPGAMKYYKEVHLK